jgi:hypothetical protein
LTEFTFEQKRFLAHHKISPNSLFDARGMESAIWMPMMKQEEKLFCFGAAPCMRSKKTPSPHTFRERANHCIECETKNIHHMKLNAAKGFVYISASMRLKMIKVGYSKAPNERERTINGYEYGGANDWQIIAQMFFAKNAGQAEFEVHTKLEPFASPQTYLANGHRTQCSEIFACGYPLARRALIDAAGSEGGLKERSGAS